MTSGITLFVAQLDKRIDEYFLRNEFSKYGDLFKASVPKDENGESKGYGFVDFCSSKDGLNAMKEMAGKLLLGRIIDVQIANSQTKEGSCYNFQTNTMWADNWNQDSPPMRPETDCDDQSQISDAAGDQNSEGQWGIKERMKKLFESQMYTDVKFFPKNNRNQSISAHRAVLAIGSPLFQKMLFSDQNKDTAGMKMEVQISNMAFDAFTNIVKYIYTDEVFFESDALVQEILNGAKQFGIQRLVNRCSQYFESLELTEQNVCSKLQLSITNKIEVLKERCLEFIQKNTLKVINSPEFQHCTPNTMRVICKLQSLNLHNEKELLDAVMKWLYTHPPQSRKQIVEPLLKCIRFLTFSVSELGDTLKEHSDLLKSDDGLSIMLYLYNPPKTPNFQTLPSWVYKNTCKRCFFSEDPSQADQAAEPIPAPTHNRFLLGKIFFPLKQERGQIEVTDLASLLQMKCISGLHEIKAIKLIFEKPSTPKSFIENLSIKIHVSPSSFETIEVVNNVRSEMVRVEFKRGVKVRRGDLVDIEVEAKGANFYRFLQFDDACKTPMNPHFQCCMVSRPKQASKLYFISEVEYGPQMHRPGLNVTRKKKPSPLHKSAHSIWGREN